MESVLRSKVYRTKNISKTDRIYLKNTAEGMDFARTLFIPI